jgi:hypothetical protein
MEVCLEEDDQHIKNGKKARLGLLPSITTQVLMVELEGWALCFTLHTYFIIIYFLSKIHKEIHSVLLNGPSQKI